MFIDDLADAVVEALPYVSSLQRSASVASLSSGDALVPLGEHGCCAVRCAPAAAAAAASAAASAAGLWPLGPGCVLLRRVDAVRCGQAVLLDCNRQGASLGGWPVCLSLVPPNWPAWHAAVCSAAGSPPAPEGSPQACIWLGTSRRRGARPASAGPARCCSWRQSSTGRPPCSSALLRCAALLCGGAAQRNRAWPHLSRQAKPRRTFALTRPPLAPIAPHHPYLLLRTVPALSLLRCRPTSAHSPRCTTEPCCSCTLLTCVRSPGPVPCRRGGCAAGNVRPRPQGAARLGVLPLVERTGN